MEKSTL